MISLNIDVKKINKSRLFEGKKGTYLDAVLIETPNSEYGDYMIVQSVSKEEREHGIKGEILGNAKIIVRREQPSSPPQDNPPSDDSGIDDLPF